MTSGNTGFINVDELDAVRVGDALDGLRRMLAADGYELEFTLAGDGVDLTVIATETGCAECLVSKDLLRSLAIDMLRKGMINIEPGALGLTYPGE